MKLYEATGVTKTNELRATKPISALLVRMNQALSALTNEVISVWIERTNGNTDLAVKIPLADFILLSTHGESNTYAQIGGIYVCCAICELTPDLAIHLEDNESIKITMDGLKPLVTYSLHGIEEPITGNQIIHFDKKTVLVGETSRKFGVNDYESVCITNYSSVDFITLTYDNGMTQKLERDEFIAISIDTDPVLAIDEGSSITQQDSNRLVFPLVGVEYLEIEKDNAVQVTLILKDDKISY